MKEKKLIFGATAVIAVIILIVALVTINKNGKEEETSPVRGTNANGEVTTNYFDNIDVYEGERETITDADGNVIGQKSDDITGEVVTDEEGNPVVDIDMPGVDGDDKNDNKNKDDKKKDNKDGDVVDDFVVIEEDDVQSPTNKDGEIVSEEYPGQADGWSPIVSPDELNN